MRKSAIIFLLVDMCFFGSAFFIFKSSFILLNKVHGCHVKFVLFELRAISAFAGFCYIFSPTMPLV